MQAGEDSARTESARKQASGSYLQLRTLQAFGGASVAKPGPAVSRQGNPIGIRCLFGGSMRRAPSICVSPAWLHRPG